MSKRDGPVCIVRAVSDASGRVTATSHYRDAFVAVDAGVRNHLVISGVEAPRVLGFPYRNLGSKSIGQAVLEANRRYFAAELP